MKRTRLRLTLCTALVACILGFIWGNSMMPASESSRVSGLVGELLEKFLPFLDMDGENAMHILRKIAHFSEFAALGLCLCWLFGMLEKPVPLPVLCGVAAACVDECIQLFSPGRASALTDVLIDSAGAVTGVMILLLCCRLKKPGR